MNNEFDDVFKAVIHNYDDAPNSPPKNNDQMVPNDEIDFADFLEQIETSQITRVTNETTPDVSDEEFQVFPLKPKKEKKILQKVGTLKPKKLQLDPEIITNKPVEKNDIFTTKDQLIALQKKRLSDNDGTWVQCCQPKCGKWRYLPDVVEPFKIPPAWFCSQNPDKNRNSCNQPEIIIDGKDFVFTKYTSGSIVWAKLSGYPWWPGMIEDDPDVLEFFWANDSSDSPTHYHVVFLDDKVSRAWVARSCIRPFGRDSKVQTTVAGKDYKAKMKPALKRANEALNLDISERLEKFSFVKTYKGKWPKAHKNDETENEDAILDLSMDNSAFTETIKELNDITNIPKISKPILELETENYPQKEIGIPPQLNNYSKGTKTTTKSIENEDDNNENVIEKLTQEIETKTNAMFKIPAIPKQLKKTKKLDTNIVFNDIYAVKRKKEKVITSSISEPNLFQESLKYRNNKLCKITKTERSTENSSSLENISMSCAVDLFEKEE